jgi:hypothetical protein
VKSVSWPALARFIRWASARRPRHCWLTTLPQNTPMARQGNRRFCLNTTHHRRTKCRCACLTTLRAFCKPMAIQVMARCVEITTSLESVVGITPGVSSWGAPRRLSLNAKANPRTSPRPIGSEPHQQALRHRAQDQSVECGEALPHSSGTECARI